MTLSRRVAATQLTFVALLLCGPVAQAAQVRVRLAPARAVCVAGATLTAVPERGKSLKVTLQSDAVSVLTLAESVDWTISVEHAGCWGDTRAWSRNDGSEIVLGLYAAASVVGTFEGPKAGTIHTVRAQVHPGRTGEAGEARPLPPPSVSNSPCTVAQSVWRCTAPAEVPFDLRLDVPGFASLYYWDVTAQAGEARELEPQLLVPGASIAGWVHGAKDVPLGARVSVMPREPQTRTSEHAAVRVQTVRTTAKGFFQVRGLAPGAYRIVSEASGVSPAVVQVDARAGEEVVLPRPIRHVPFAELTVRLDPPADRRGRPWTVKATEVTPLYPGRHPVIVAHRATEDGQWTARGLRADAYEVTVHDTNGSLLHRAMVDLLEGGPATLPLSIPQIAVRGVVRSGDEPLRADLQLWNQDRGLVTVATDADGRFETALPGTGTWMPTVLYPPGRSAARISAAPFVIPANVPQDAPHEIVVQLPGGRIHGTVVSAEDTKGPAVVHAFLGGRLAAQQRTDEDGAFNFIGLDPGTYHLDAQSAAGSTPKPVAIVLEEDETHELTLVTEPYARLAGFVVTPDGRPASGAVVKFSVDGIYWNRLVTDVRGYFERDVQRSAQRVQLIVLMYSYPASLLAVPLSNGPIRIALRPDGGVLRVRGPAVLSARGVTAPAHVFRFESTALFDGRIYLESGTYTACRTSVPDDTCRSLIVQPASEQEVELGAPSTAGETP